MTLPTAQQLQDLVRRREIIHLETPTYGSPFTVQSNEHQGLVVRNAKGNARRIPLLEIERFLMLSADPRHAVERRRRSFNSSYRIAILAAYERPE